MACYTRIESVKGVPFSFNMGVAFFILFLFFSNSFAVRIYLRSVSVSASAVGYDSPSYLYNNYAIPDIVNAPNNEITLSCLATAGSFYGGNSVANSINVVRPANVTGWSYLVYLSGTCSASGSGSVNCLVYGNSTANATCIFYAEVNSSSLLSCSDPVLISDSRCEGGQGLWRADNSFSDVFGNDHVDVIEGSRSYWLWQNGAVAWAYTVVGLNEPSLELCPLQSNGICPFERPDGSECIPDVYSFVSKGNIACPLGFAESSSSSEPSSSSSSELCPDEDPACVCAINPNSIICQSSSSSESDYCSFVPPPPGCGLNSDDYDPCNDFPTLPYCECKRNPSLPWCSNMPSSNSNTTPSSSSFYSNDLCTDFPNLIFCQSSASGSNSGGGGTSSPSGVNNDGGVNFGGGNGGTPSNGNDPDGVTCLKNNNCNWARIDVQLEQLGVEEQTMKTVKEIADLQKAGYNLTNEQNILLHSVLQAVNSGNASVVEAINGLASAVGSASSVSTEESRNQLTAWQDMLNKTFGTDGSKLDNMGTGSDSLNGSLLSGIGDKLDSLLSGIGDFFKEGLNKFAGDTTGTGAFDNSLKEYGTGSGSAMGDSLGSGLGARDKIKKAIKVDSTDFKFLGSSEKCPVWDFSFNWSVGKVTLACSSVKCKINICDVYGFNFGVFFRALIWLGASVLILYMNLRVLQSGGR